MDKHLKDLEMSQLTRVMSDLTCGLGFSRANAEVAIDDYIHGNLPPEEMDAMRYLHQRDPFTRAIGQPRIMFNQERMSILNKMNYRISVS